MALPTDIKEMLEMRLNETAVFDAFIIVRVPGGWLYSRAAQIWGIHSVFVPEPLTGPRH